MKLFCISRYRSGLGEFKPGQELDVADEIAELLLRDSPGSFSRENPAAPAPDEGAEPTATGIPAHDRRARGGHIR